jgi:hypothetical protein
MITQLTVGVWGSTRFAEFSGIAIVEDSLFENAPQTKQWCRIFHIPVRLISDIET